MLKKILSVPLSLIFYIIFGLLLLIFHVAQVISLKLGGYKAHKRSVELLNLSIIKSFLILGNRVKFEGVEKIPFGRPLIIVSNHQSAWDIPPMVWNLKQFHPKFISKKELAKNIPSISYNLRHGGHFIIDRKSGTKAVHEVSKLGEVIEKNNWAACIFAEGTRSENGMVKRFQYGGIRSLLKASPSALIIPLAIENNYKLQPGKSFIIGLGVKMNFKILDPIEPGDCSPEELIDKTELAIKQALNQA